MFAPKQYCVQPLTAQKNFCILFQNKDVAWGSKLNLAAKQQSVKPGFHANNAFDFVCCEKHSVAILWSACYLTEDSTRQKFRHSACWNQHYVTTKCISQTFQNPLFNFFQSPWCRKAKATRTEPTKTQRTCGAECFDARRFVASSFGQIINDSNPNTTGSCPGMLQVKKPLRPTSDGAIFPKLSGLLASCFPQFPRSSRYDTNRSDCVWPETDKQL